MAINYDELWPGPVCGEIGMNIYESLPDATSKEVFTDLLSCKTVRIERIVSRGQASPPSGWYDQDENEWVVILKGRARLAFAGGREVALGEGDCIDIPRHVRHRVSWTDPGQNTVWLAVFYD